MRAISIFIVSITVFSCNKKTDRFKSIDYQSSGISFENKIELTDSFNILTYEYIYNGGGVGIADFDNNGLLDIYFTGNMVPNELYLNRGNLRFENVTTISNAEGEGKWSSAVAIADVNGDGWQDIFVCITAHPNPNERENMLYINQGLNSDGIPVFINEAEKYHLNDTSHSSAAAFFDYDKDGDLDLYVASNKMTNNRTANVYKKREQSPDRIDKLFRNDLDSLTGQRVFTNVSEQAGIIYDGYSLGVNVTDINKDSWPDVFVTNDYLSNDLVLINNGNGSFTNLADKVFKHTSHSSMGNDIVDVNNDGLPDVITVDMLPEDNFRRKTMLGPNNYASYINNEKYGFQYQYVRNTLQVNQGNLTDSIPLFSDLSFLSGISSTDWSWAPLVADFDNDGFRDMIITNGFPKDVTDRDFIDYYAQSSNYGSKSYFMNFIPSVKIKNYAYRNINGIEFENVTDAWGIKDRTFSNGAAYADLDNDGDLDYVVNNINDKATLFENLTNQNFRGQNWLRIHLIGQSLNSNGLGAKVYLYSSDKEMYSDHSTFRGYLSTVEPDLHFGLGQIIQVDSIKVFWLDGKVSIIKGIKSNQVLTINYNSSKEIRIDETKNKQMVWNDKSNLFSPFVHQEADFIDFNIQPLLLHKFSQSGPGIAVGDVDGNGLDDIYVSGSTGYSGNFFSQTRENEFRIIDIFNEKDFNREELGVLLFDADGDGDLDFYSARGGYEFPDTSAYYQDFLFENVKGKLIKTNSLPKFRVSSSCVRAADFDRDGDLDLFVGGRVAPQKYPMPVSSFLLINNSTKESIKFDFGDESIANFNNIGMVTDALWTDFNNDDWVDLIIVGEWSPIRFFTNVNGKLNEVKESGVHNKIGWWNSISTADFDLDGDMDYVVGNLGKNTLLKATDQEQVSIYSGDFDNNGNIDFIPTIFLKDTLGIKHEYPFFGRLDTQKEIIRVKKGFLKHADFGTATIENILTKEEISNSLKYKANYLSSAYLKNNGAGKFELIALPVTAQISPINGLLTDDFDDDNKPDIIAIGNDFGTELSMGKMDAFYGLMLKGNGAGEFKNLNIKGSGICVEGDAKGLASLVNDSGYYYILATQNRGPLKSYARKINPKRIIRIDPNIISVEISLNDGSKTRKEFNYGSGFLSQSSRCLIIPTDAKKIIMNSFQGVKTELNF